MNPGLTNSKVGYLVGDLFSLEVVNKFVSFGTDLFRKIYGFYKKITKNAEQ